jgi:hypothetical protein
VQRVLTTSLVPGSLISSGVSSENELVWFCLTSLNLFLVGERGERRGFTADSCYNSQNQSPSIVSNVFFFLDFCFVLICFVLGCFGLFFFFFFGGQGGGRVQRREMSGLS